MEKVVRKKGKDFDAQMAPKKGVCSVNSRFCCDVISSKCILGYQTKTVHNSWVKMLNMLEVLCLPKASPWYPAKSQLIMRLPSQIAWPWELVESGFTNIKLFPLARTPGGYSGQSALIRFCSHKVNSWAVSYYKDANCSFSLVLSWGSGSEWNVSSAIRLPWNLVRTFVSPSGWIGERPVWSRSTSISCTHRKI